MINTKFRPVITSEMRGHIVSVNTDICLINVLLVLRYVIYVIFILVCKIYCIFLHSKKQKFQLSELFGVLTNPSPHFCLFLVLVYSDSLILTSSLLSETYFKVTQLVCLAYIQLSPLKHNIKIAFHLKKWQILSPRYLTITDFIHFISCMVSILQCFCRFL